MGKLNEIYLDFGNGFWKSKHGKRIAMTRNAIVALSEQQWNAITQRGVPVLNADGGYLRVNGAPYAIGEQARRQIIAERPRGSARYTQEYYGVGLCFVMALMLEGKTTADVDLVASYAPQDVIYTKDIKASSVRSWRIDANGQSLRYNVKSATLFDEPLAGSANVIFTDNGDERRDNPLSDGATLVIDVGSYTADTVAIDGGHVDLTSLKSTVTGAIDALERFEQALKENNRLLFKGIKGIDIKRLERALLTGQFQAGAETIDCQREAREAVNVLANDVLEIVNSQGGYINYDQMLLTGGGSMIVYETLVTALPRARFILADNKGEMIFANVKGLEKTARALDKMGA